MLKKKGALIFSVLIFLFTVVAGASIAAAATTMQVTPSSTTTKMGQTFSLNVTINQVTALTAWQFTIYYSNAALKCTGATEGSFLNSTGSTYFVKNIKDAYNATHGQLTVGCTLLGIVPGVSGSGVLATVTFRANAPGDLLLHLEDTQLADANIPPKPIPHTTADGSVHVDLVTGHDVAVTDIITSKTVVCNGCAASFNVTVRDLGQYPESFSVTLYANATQIKTQTVSLTSGNSTTITLTWTSVNASVGNYMLRAEAPLQTDIDPVDNTMTDGTIPVSIAGDVNADGKVNIVDISIVAAAFNTRPGSQKWNPNADIDNNGVINIVDITKVAKEFGKTRQSLQLNRVLR